MTVPVAVVDLGAGNLFSICNALRAVGSEFVVVSDSRKWESVRPAHVVLPGVGAFGPGMVALRERNLVEPLTEHSSASRPLLGICLGAQMLLEESDEFGLSAGLGVVPGRVEVLSNCGTPVPHVGWAPLEVPARTTAPSPAFVSADWMYFVHSYVMRPTERGSILYQSQAGSCSFASGVMKDLTIGLQFHPEKSGEAGLRLLQAFVSL